MLKYAINNRCNANYFVDKVKYSKQIQKINELISLIYQYSILEKKDPKLLKILDLCKYYMRNKSVLSVKNSKVDSLTTELFLTAYDYFYTLMYIR